MACSLQRWGISESAIKGQPRRGALVEEQVRPLSGHGRAARPRSTGPQFVTGTRDSLPRRRRKPARSVPPAPRGDRMRARSPTRVRGVCADARTSWSDQSRGGWTPDQQDAYRAPPVHIRPSADHRRHRFAEVGHRLPAPRSARRCRTHSGRTPAASAAPSTSRATSARRLRLAASTNRATST
jgi:hypothetical protein